MVELSREQAVGWLESRLGVKDVEGRLRQGDRRTLLNDIMRAYQRDVPFQTMTISSQDLSERHVPTSSEICSNILALKGGVCIDLNYFMKILLQALDYDVCLLGGNYTADSMPFTHIMVLVKSLESEGDKFLVDVGCGFPTFEVVPLEKLPHTYVQSGLEIMYTRDGDKFFRMQRKGDFITDDTPPIMKDGWRMVFDFELVARELEFFDEPMKSFFFDGPFTEDLHLCRFPEPGQKMIAFKDNTKYSYDDEHPELGLQKEIVPYEQLEEAISKHFPNLCKNEISKALKHYMTVWHKV